MTASEKADYLQKLAESLSVDDSTAEGKLLLAALDVIGSMARDIEDLEANLAELAHAVDDIGDDIVYLEDMCCGTQEDGDEAPASCSGDCSGCAGCGGEQEYEVVCPECGETVSITQADLEFGSMLCPFCDTELEFDLDEEE